MSVNTATSKKSIITFLLPSDLRLTLTDLDILPVGAEHTHDHEEHEDGVVAARRADRSHHKLLVLVEERRAARVRF